MKNLRFAIAALFLLCATAIFADDYSVSGNYVTIPVKNASANGAKTVRLQVVNDNIIRVQATPENALPQKESLIIVAQPDFRNFTVGQNGNTIEVKTKNVRATVDAVNGRVMFYDKNGKRLLQEQAQGGKTFEPFTVPDREVGVGKLTEKERHGWTWHTVFDSPKDEAFYGLGQHQSEELNMKGKNEDLFQYNTKVSVPFVVSNKNYGILWDSYSYCRWGNPNDYLQLNRAFTLYDKNKQRGSLTGTYTDRDGKTIERAEDSIYYEFALPELAWGDSKDLGVANLPNGFRLNGAKVVYEGYLQAPVTNNYHFILYYAGYMKVYIGGK